MYQFSGVGHPALTIAFSRKDLISGAGEEDKEVCSQDESQCGVAQASQEICLCLWCVNV